MAGKHVAFKKISSNQSLSASFNTEATLIRYMDNVSYQINVTTTDSQGNFAVQVSNDYQVDEVDNIANTGTWVSITLAGGAPIVSATSDQIAINLNQLGFNAVRLSYTATTAGTGTCNIFVLSKRLAG